jgi:hypothetical protein
MIYYRPAVAVGRRAGCTNQAVDSCFYVGKVLTGNTNSTNGKR